MTNKTGEQGPVYGVDLIDTLPMNGGFWQSMPRRKELERVRNLSERTVAAYEVLLDYWHRTSHSVEVEELKARVTELKAEIKRLEHYIAAETEVAFLKQGRS